MVSEQVHFYPQLLLGISGRGGDEPEEMPPVVKKKRRHVLKLTSHEIYIYLEVLSMPEMRKCLGDENERLR